MIFDLPIADPQRILPSTLYSFFSKLTQDEKIDLKVFIQKLQALPETDIRLFALLHLHKHQLLPKETFTILASAFLTDLDETIQWHCLLFLGYYESTSTTISTLTPFLSSPCELVRAATSWTLAKLHPDTLSATTVYEELTTTSDSDRSRILLGAALYLLDSSPTSFGMQYLKKYFLTEYWDIENNNYYSTVLLGKYGLSAEILAEILWISGVKIVSSTSLDSLELNWLLGY